MTITHLRQKHAGRNILYKYISNSYQTKYCRYHINWGLTGGGGVLCISLFAILGYPQFKLKLIDSHLLILKSIVTVKLDVNLSTVPD